MSGQGHLAVKGYRHRNQRGGRGVGTWKMRVPRKVSCRRLYRAGMYMLATRLDSAVFTNWATNSFRVRLLISALTVWCLRSTLEDNCRVRKTRNLLLCLCTMPSNKLTVVGSKHVLRSFPYAVRGMFAVRLDQQHHMAATCGSRASRMI